MERLTRIHSANSSCLLSIMILIILKIVSTTEVGSLNRELKKPIDQHDINPTNRIQYIVDPRFMRRARQPGTSTNYGNNLRPFQQLGHYSRSLIRRMQQRKQQGLKESTSLIPTQTPFQNPNPNEYRRQMALKPMALSQTQSQEDDNKRNVFVSSGWAPSGLIEIQPETQSQNKVIADNKKTNKNAYAFTSNHWGPMGKRRDNGSVSKRVMDLAYIDVEHQLEPPRYNFVEIDSNDMIQPVIELVPETIFYQTRNSKQPE